MGDPEVEGKEIEQQERPEGAQTPKEKDPNHTKKKEPVHTEAEWNGW